MSDLECVCVKTFIILMRSIWIINFCGNDTWEWPLLSISYSIYTLQCWVIFPLSGLKFRSCTGFLNISSSYLRNWLFVRFSRGKIVISLFTVTRLLNMVNTRTVLFSSLSKTYTNHNVRVIAIMMWSNAQVPSRHIYGSNLRPPLWNKPQKLKWRMLHRLMYQNSPS